MITVEEELRLLKVEAELKSLKNLNSSENTFKVMPAPDAYQDEALR